MVKAVGDFMRIVKDGTQVLGAVIPGLLIALLKLNFLAIFCWYAIELTADIGRHAWFAGAMIAMSSLCLICAAVWVLVAVHQTQTIMPLYRPPPGPLRPYVILALVPVAAIFVLSQLGQYTFHEPLSAKTAIHLGRFYYWIRHWTLWQNLFA